MGKYYDRLRKLIFSGTAKDTYLLFFSNVVTAFLGFVFTWLLARNLSVGDFGIFSAVSNFVFMAIAVTDIGVSAGLVNFVARLEAEGKFKEAEKYIKAAFNVWVGITFFLSLLLIFFSKRFSPLLFATNNPAASVWAGLILVGLFLPNFFLFLFRAKKDFLKSVMVDISYSFSRLAFAVIFSLGGLTLFKSFGAFAAASLVTLGLVGFTFGFSFLKSKTEKAVYRTLLSFSGWLGVNRILSSVAGRIDVQMLAFLAGSVVTGYYSLAAKLVAFISALISSFSAVLAPRLAGFNDPEREKRYLQKSVLVLLPITAGILLWVLIAKPFIVILFGEKYLNSVGYFQALALSAIPFLFTTPSITAIIYALRKPIYIGAFSVFQVTAVFGLNAFFIPRIGAYGPAVALGVTNLIAAIYSWAIVIKHYWGKNSRLKNQNAE